MSKILDISKWRSEIQLAEEFREKEFGVYTPENHFKAGCNIDYFERGYQRLIGILDDDEVITTLNLVHAIVKNVVPSLYYQNPRILALPKKVSSSDTAPVVTEVANHYYRNLDVEETNQKIIWDAYVLGHGYSKVGYATTLGMDVDEEDEKKKKSKKSIIDKGLEALGLKKKEEETPEEHPEVNYNIVSENPYIIYVSPFDFIRDPRALTMEESMWVGQKFVRTVTQMKENKKYSDTNLLKGVDPDINTSSYIQLSQSALDDFKTVDLYEIHYRSKNKMYLLVISKDNDTFRAHYHEESIYKLDGWQYDELTYNKHGHKAFAISDITKMKHLQDRFTATIDAILEQVDKFQPKIAFSGTDITPEGKNALMNGGIGALVDCTKNPSEVFREINLTQFKADLKALADQIIEIVTIQTGITRAQLTGMATGASATEVSIAQGGQTLRISDMTQATQRFSNKQARKLWQIIRQFVDLEKLELITGVSGIDPQTGFPTYNWITIDEERSSKMTEGEYDFEIEVGSTQKPDLSVLRKQFENLFSILARTDVITLMQQQGNKVDLAELLRMYLRMFPDAVKDIGKIIQKINQNTTGLVPPEQDGRGGTTNGSQFNALEAQSALPVPGVPSEIGASR